jgi:hypothetical protein
MVTNWTGKRFSLEAGKPLTLVTDGQERSVLAACRMLATSGYEVDVAASAHPAPGQWSRCCRERHRVTDLQIRLDDGGQRQVDHVILGTGYQVDVASYDFLADELIAQLEVRDGSPVLSRGLSQVSRGCTSWALPRPKASARSCASSWVPGMRHPLLPLQSRQPGYDLCIPPTARAAPGVATHSGDQHFRWRALQRPLTATPTERLLRTPRPRASKAKAKRITAPAGTECGAFLPPRLGPMSTSGRRTKNAGVLGIEPPTIWHRAVDPACAPPSRRCLAAPLIGLC